MEVPICGRWRGTTAALPACTYRRQGLRAAGVTACQTRARVHGPRCVRRTHGCLPKRASRRSLGPRLGSGPSSPGSGQSATQ